MLKSTSLFYLLLFFILFPIHNGVSAQEMGKIQLTEKEKSWIAENHLIRARVGNNPPLHFFDGQNRGISIDYFNLIAEKVGLNVQYINGISWSEGLDNIKNQEKIDLILTAKNSEERRPYMRFSDDYLLMPWVVFSRTDSEFISSIDDLIGKTVAVEKNFVMQRKLMTEYPGINLLVKNTPAETLEAVASSEADAYIGNLATSTYIINQQNLANLKVACPVPFDNHNQAFVVRNDWPELVSILNKSIKAIPQNTMSELRNKWFNVQFEEGISKALFFKWIGLIVTVSLVFLLFFARWNRRLTKEIARRKQMQTTLRQSEQKYKRLFNKSPIPLWEEDFTDVVKMLQEIMPGGVHNIRDYLAKNPEYVQLLVQNVKIVDVNQAALELHGAENKDDLLGNLDKIFTEKSLDTFVEELITIANGGTELKIDGEIKTIDGERKTLSLSFLFDRISEDQLLVLLATMDITERIEKELEHKRLATALEQVADSVLITDQNALITYVNPAFEKVTGYTSEEVMGKNPGMMKSGMHDSSFYTSMWETLEKGIVWHGEVYNKHKNGSLLYEEVSIAPIKDENGTIFNYVSVRRDVTEIREAQKHLQQTQKMESIGNLAGGIAHDFNNILSSILGFSEMILESVDKKSTVHSDVQEIYNAGIRAKELVSQILLFARKTDEELKPIKVEPVVTEVLSFLKSTIPTTITLSKVSSSNATIKGNATQLHQVLMNICTNAVHAIDNTMGTIDVRLEDIANGQTENTLLRPGKYIKISITDSGKGISRDNLESIFEPYFTTKGMTKGTGLGLSVAQGIVKAYGGHILVESDMGIGTTFIIYIPTIAQNNDETPHNVPKITRGDERILLVDDEIELAEIGERMLSSLGYQVTTKTNSIEALELFTTSPSDFDLIISDMTMPNMTGDDLAMECMKIRPNLPVILCTGFSNKLSQEEALAMGIKAFIFKPMVKGDLASTIRKVLDTNR